MEELNLLSRKDGVCATTNCSCSDREFMIRPFVNFLKRRKEIQRCRRGSVISSESSAEGLNSGGVEKKSLFITKEELRI